MNIKGWLVNLVDWDAKVKPVEKTAEEVAKDVHKFNTENEAREFAKNNKDMVFMGNSTGKWVVLHDPLKLLDDKELTGTAKKAFTNPDKPAIILVAPEDGSEFKVTIIDSTHLSATMVGGTGTPAILHKNQVPPWMIGQLKENGLVEGDGNYFKEQEPLTEVENIDAKKEVVAKVKKISKVRKIFEVKKASAPELDPVATQIAEDLKKAGFTDGTDVSPEIALFEYGMLRNPATDETIMASGDVQSGEVAFTLDDKKFDIVHISLDDVKVALEEAAEGFFKFIGSTKEEELKNLSKDYVSGTVHSLNMYNGYWDQSAEYNLSLNEIKNRFLGKKKASRKLKHAKLYKKSLEMWKPSENYMGEDYSDYYVFLTQHRDSENLEISNFITALNELGGEGNGVLKVSFNHWMVGWVEAILIQKDAKDKIAIAEKLEAELEDYPILDDNDYMRREDEKFKDWYKTWGKGDAIEALKEEGVAEDEINEEAVQRAFMDMNSDGYEDMDKIKEYYIDALKELGIPNSLTDYTLPGQEKLDLKEKLKARFREGKGGKKEVVKEIEDRKEVKDKVRCNKCMTVHDENIEECPKCKTDKYLMQPFKESSLKEIKASQEDINIRPSFIKYCKVNSHYWAVMEKEAKWYRIPAELEDEFTKYSIMEEGFMKGEEDCPTCKALSRNKKADEEGELKIGDKVTFRGDQEGKVVAVNRAQDVYSDSEELEKYKTMNGLNLDWGKNSIVSVDVEHDGVITEFFVKNVKKIGTGLGSDVAPEVEKEAKDLPVSTKKERIPPEQVEELQKKSPKISDAAVEAAKESSNSLQALADKIALLQKELSDAEEKAEKARDSVLAKEKVEDKAEKIREIASELDTVIGAGKEVAVKLKNEILAKIETQKENIKYTYPKEINEKVLKDIKKLEEDKKTKVDKFIKQLDDEITAFKEKSAKGIEKLITTNVRLTRFPMTEGKLNKESSIFSIFKGIINSIKSWTKGLLGLAKEIEAL